MAVSTAGIADHRGAGYGEEAGLPPAGNGHQSGEDTTPPPWTSSNVDFGVRSQSAPRASERSAERLLGVRQWSEYDTTSGFHRAGVAIRGGPSLPMSPDSDTNGHQNGHHTVLGVRTSHRGAPVA